MIGWLHLCSSYLDRSGSSCVQVSEGTLLATLDRPRCTVHANVRLDIPLDIRKIKDVRVELSVQPRISVVNFAL